MNSENRTSFSMLMPPLELDESVVLPQIITPSYGDGNIDSRKNHSSRRDENITRSQIKYFINHGDEIQKDVHQSYPLVRLKYLGRGSSASVYKSVLVNQLYVVAEKVVVVGNKQKRIQLIRELESLKFSLKSSQNNDNSFYCPYIVNVIDGMLNHFNIFLEFFLIYFFFSSS